MKEHLPISVRRSPQRSIRPYPSDITSEVTLTAVSRWLMNEASGSTATDSIGSNDGAYTTVGYGGETIITGGGDSIIFDGATSLMAIPHAAEFAVDEFSVVIYFRPESLPPPNTQRTLVQKDAGGVVGGWSIELFNDAGTGRVRAYTKNEAASATWVGSNVGLGEVITGQSYLVELQVSGGETQLWLDKVLLGTTTQNVGGALNTQEIGVGVYRPSVTAATIFRGEIAGVTFYAGGIDSGTRAALANAITPTVTPPAGSYTEAALLTAPGKTVTVAPAPTPGTTINMRPSANEVYDLRDKNYLSGGVPSVPDWNYPFQLRDAPAGTGVFGGEFTGLQPRDTTWRIMKCPSEGKQYDGDSLRIEVAGGYPDNPIIVEACKFTNTMDAISTPTKNYSASYVVIKHCYIEYMRDDIENDTCIQADYEDCLIDNAFMVYSERPAAGCSNPQRPTNIRRVLASFLGMPYTFDCGDPSDPASLPAAGSTGCGWFFKAGTNNGPINASDCMILVNGVNVNGWSKMSIPAGTHSNNKVIWIGEGPWQGPALPSGWSFGTQADWDAARQAWLEEHNAELQPDGSFDFPWLHA